MTATSITGRKIKIAVVGCGRISKNHFGSIEKYPEDFELVGVCDTDPDRANDAAKKYGGEAFTQLEDMLKNCDADVYSLCTPSGLHPEQCIKIAEAGKHVLTEKPMATTWQDGLKMVEATDKARVKLFVVKQNRLNNTLQLLKNTVNQGRFGQIYTVTINVFWTRPQDYYDQADWRGTKKLDGGALMNQASHYVDLLTWLVGPVDQVFSFTATQARKIECEDTATLNLKWKNGALGTMNVTMLTYPKNFEGSLTIIGEKGTVRVGGLAVNEIQHWEFDEPHADDDKIRSASYETTSVYGFGHPAYYKNVVDTLRGEAEIMTCGREGLKSLELLVAAYMSSQENRPIQLPLETTL